MSALEPGTRIGEYEIVGFIGAGGMGEVYRARDPDIGRDVAIKVLPASFAADRSRVARFEQEARAAGVLSHPNLLTIFELGTHDGAPFIVSELLEGQTLARRIAAGPIPQQRAIGYAIQIANGLAAAHAKGILHRDLKPENIFITTDERVKILDFGLAKLTQPENDERTLQKSAPGMVAGTPAYMSPEQVRGEPIDARSDIFALGIILYEMLSGQQPFRARSAVETMNAALTADPPPLPNVSAHLQRIVHRSLEKSPDLRVQSARDFAFELETVSAFHGAPQRRWGVWVAVPLLAAVLIGLWLVRQRHIAAPATQSIDSLAVLPFVNATNDPKSEYLSDGVSDSIINSISQLPQVKVMSQSTMFRFKGKNVDPQEVGRQLNVHAIVAGRVTELGDRLTVEAELIDTRDGSQIWGEQYNRNLSDIFSIEEELARDITEKLRLRLTRQQEQLLTKRYTTDTEAYELYAKGREEWNRRTPADLERAVQYFQQAIARDPHYAVAYVGLADSYAVLLDWAAVSETEARQKAKDAVTRAIQIDDRLGEAHATLGLLSDYDWAWDAGEQQFRRAIELNPNYATGYQWYANHLARERRFSEAVAMFERAEAVDPLSPIIKINLGFAKWYAGEQQQAIAMYRDELRSDPNSAGFHLYLGRLLVAGGSPSAGLQELKVADNLYHSRAPGPRSALAYALGVTGDGEEALRIAHELEALNAAGRCPSVYVAMAYAGFDNASAIRWLRQALAKRDALLSYLNMYPELERIRKTPAGMDILRQMGLPTSDARLR